MPDPSPRLSATEALSQLLAIRALSGVELPVRVYRAQKSHRIRFIEFCENNGWTRYWYYRHPRIEIVDTMEHDMRWQPILQHRWQQEFHGVEWSGAADLAAITRRAFVPLLTVQLYSHHNPMLSLLKKP
jgi:hypothetical protein